jgi:S-adenosylmethionine decarboxylase proenzyme
MIACFFTLPLLATSEFKFSGTHYVASFKNCNHNAITDIANLRETMLKAARASGATVLGFSDYVFAPNGFTMVILLSESHASIHTYPEVNACFVDLFTCGTHCSSNGFVKVLQ